jgi:hypothetical protein
MCCYTSASSWRITFKRSFCSDRRPRRKALCPSQQTRQPSPSQRSSKPENSENYAVYSIINTTHTI